jgi:hypothetical protein
MSELKAVCPSCSAVLQLADSRVGEEVRCPACRGVVTVSVDAAPEPPDPGVTVTPAPRPKMRLVDDPPPPRSKAPLVLVALALVFVVCGGFVTGAYYAWRWLTQPPAAVRLDHDENKRPEGPADGFPTPDAALDAHLKALTDAEREAECPEGKFKRFDAELTGSDEARIVFVVRGAPEADDTYRRYVLVKRDGGWWYSHRTAGDAGELDPRRYAVPWDRAAARGPLDLQEGTKKALAGVTLKPLDIRFKGVEFTIQAPEGAKVTEVIGGLAVSQGDRFNLIIETGRLNLNLVKTRWPAQTKRWLGVVAEQGDCLVFRAVSKYHSKPTYSFVANATLGHLDVHFRDTSLASLADPYAAPHCLLMLHCARTATLNAEYRPVASPDDFRRLGWKLEQDETTGRIVEADPNGNGCTDATLALLVKYAPDLETLWLPATVTDDGLKPLASLPRLRRLYTGVGLSGGYKDGSGFVHLAKLKNLEKLSLFGNELPPEVFVHVKALDSLKELDLAYTTFAPKDLEQLNGLGKLENLSLDHSSLTDEGLQHLGGLTNLVFLGLSETKITDAGLKQLSGLKMLRRLNARKTGVTEQGAAELRNALPELELTVGD